MKNEAFLRDFLQKRSFEDQKRSISARLPSKLTCWADTWPQNSNTFQWFSSGCFKSTAPATKKLSLGIRSPVTATRHDHCKVTLPWHEICNPSTVSASEASNIDVTEREITAPATQNESFQALFKSPTPANVFATLTKSCACHVFCNVSKSLRLPRKTHFDAQKTSRGRQFLTILTSKSLSRAGVVQFLRSSTSKRPPKPSSFNDFHCQIALARRRGANFVDVNCQKCMLPACQFLTILTRAQAWRKFCKAQLPKVLRTCQVLTILASKSLSRAGVVQILSMSTSKSAPNMPVFNDFDFQIALARRRGANFVDILGSRSSAPPRFSDLPLRTFEATKLRKNTAFRAMPTRQNLSCLTSALYNISAVKHRCCKSYRQLSV